jgi:hypothetical protein
MDTIEKDFEALSRLIRHFERLVDDRRLDTITLNKYQELLDRFAHKYQHDEAAGTRRCMLYELQALLWHARGDYEKAVDFLREAAGFMSNEYDFVSRAGQDWFHATYGA